MESGELEHRKAFEETATKNIRTVVDYSTATREIVRELQARVDAQHKQILAQNQTISELRTLLASLQSVVFKSGTE